MNSAPMAPSTIHPQAGGTGLRAVSDRAWRFGSLPVVEVWRHSLQGCATRYGRPCPGVPGAFTLVEVLMAVLILGIGLLGLGAVLPAVVKQQQASTESIMGTVAMNAAQASLRVGRQGRNEVQRIKVEVLLDPTTRAIPADASFRLSFPGSGDTPEIPVASLAANPQAIEDALTTLAGLVGDAATPERTFRVSGSSTVNNTTLAATITYDVEFIGRMGGARVELLEARGAGGVTATVNRVVAGEPALDSTFWTALAKIDPTTSGLTHGSGLAAQLLPDDAGWLVPDVETRSGTTRERGAVLLGVNAAGATYFPADRSLSIPLGERLQPSESAGGGAAVPQYVWDMAVRRMGPRRTGNDPFGVAYGPGNQPPEHTKVQSVVFLRRVDGRLSAPANSTVFQALLARAGPAADLRWPVSFNTSTEAPANDGLVSGRTYSPPIAWTVDYDPARLGPEGLANRDLIEVGGPGSPFNQVPAGATISRDAVFQMLAKPGQLLVDNLGNVYTVRGAVLASGYTYTLRVSPPVPAGVPATDTNPEDGAGSLRQIVFAPEGAVSARVEVVNP